MSNEKPLAPEGKTKHIKGTQAEKLLEAWLRKNGFPEVDRRACGTGVAVIEDKRGKQRYVGQRHDAFGCIDLIAMNDDLVWMIQVTTPDGVSKRRKKIESHKWAQNAVRHNRLWISIFTHSMRPSITDKRKMAHEWHREDYLPTINGDWTWIKRGSIPFDIHDLEAEKHEVSDEDKTEAARIVALPAEERAAAMKKLKKERKA